ncbi:hypothetical protein BSLA_01f2994 [Burkholderia stabilis]|nr:hypothetical protein BSLA_01f2994 [Burkholderia stabilis]
MRAVANPPLAVPERAYCAYQTTPSPARATCLRSKNGDYARKSDG